MWTLGVQLAILVAALALAGGMMLVVSRRVTGPLQQMQQAMLKLADGNFEVVLPGLDRKDEIGEVAARGRNVQGQGGRKGARRGAGQCRPRSCLRLRRRPSATALRLKRRPSMDREAAAARDAALAKVMNEFDAAVGGVVKAAMAGDFSQRVPLEGKEGVILNLASAMNTMCDNIGAVMDDLGERARRARRRQPDPPHRCRTIRARSAS